MGHILTKNVFFNLRIESTPGSLVFGMGISPYVINILIIYEDSQFEVVLNRVATILLWLKVA
jgi:hypothetical protein